MGKKEGKPFKIENIKLTSLTIIHKLVSLIAMPNSRNIKKMRPLSVCLNMCFCLWTILLRLICEEALFNWP